MSDALAVVALAAAAILAVAVLNAVLATLGARGCQHDWTYRGDNCGMWPPGSGTERLCLLCGRHEVMYDYEWIVPGSAEDQARLARAEKVRAAWAAMEGDDG